MQAQQPNSDMYVVTLKPFLQSLKDKGFSNPILLFGTRQEVTAALDSHNLLHLVADMKIAEFTPANEFLERLERVNE